MSAGRPPSPRTEAANQVLNAYDALEEEERRSQWKGVAWNSRFSYSKIRRQVEQNMPARIGDEPKRKAARADQTTRNGLKWLADGEHRYLVKEADGRYSRWSSVAGVLLSMESALSDVRLVLEKMSMEGPPASTHDEWVWSPLEKQRHYAKVMMASAVVRAERALDALSVDGWSNDLGGHLDIVQEIKDRRRYGAREPMVLTNKPLILGHGVSTAEFWGPMELNKPRFRVLMRAVGVDGEAFEREWREIREWRRAHPNTQRDRAEFIRKTNREKGNRLENLESPKVAPRQDQREGDERLPG